MEDAADELVGTRARGAQNAARFVPGVLLCSGISIAAMLLQRVEEGLTGRAWIESLVIAILLGALIRTGWTPDDRWEQGIRFSAKQLLEVAVALLGLSVSAATLAAAGPTFLLSIAILVLVAIAASFTIGRVLGLRPRMAILVACGNSICGNSAIAAVAPIIRAGGEDVAASIAFTAVLGVVVVIALPMLALVAGMKPLSSGMLAGLTVYAVPQVLAATMPLGPTAVQIGTLAKLTRVLMLGPVCVLASLVAPRWLSAEHDGRSESSHKPKISSFVPWFIIGFVALAACRSAFFVPEPMIALSRSLATILTIISMAALGLGCDVRVVARAGVRVTAAVTLSLVTLGALSWGLIALQGLS